MPSVRQIRLSAEARTIKIPEITFPAAFTGVQARNPLLAPALLVRFWRLRRGLLDAFPAMAFFDEPCDRFGTDALTRLLLHGFDDFLDVFGRVVEIRIHFLLLFSIQDRRTSAPGTII